MWIVGGISFSIIWCYDYIYNAVLHGVTTMFHYSLIMCTVCILYSILWVTWFPRDPQNWFTSPVAEIFQSSRLNEWMFLIHHKTRFFVSIIKTQQLILEFELHKWCIIVKLYFSDVLWSIYRQAAAGMEVFFRKIQLWTLWPMRHVTCTHVICILHMFLTVCEMYIPFVTACTFSWKWKILHCILKNNKLFAFLLK